MRPDYQLNEYEVWRHDRAGLSFLRLTTDIPLPFAGEALLSVSLQAEGLLFTDKERDISLLAAPGLEGEALQLFLQAQPKRGPLVLSEIHFPRELSRNWLVVITSPVPTGH